MNLLSKGSLNLGKYDYEVRFLKSLGFRCKNWVSKCAVIDHNFLSITAIVVTSLTNYFAAPLGSFLNFFLNEFCTIFALIAIVLHFWTLLDGLEIAIENLAPQMKEISPETEVRHISIYILSQSQD